LDAVQALLQEKSVHELTMEAIAKRAGVGKPTLYKWWPSKAALVLAMFNERLAGADESASARSAEAALRAKVRKLIVSLKGDFGKVMADLIAAG
jgi:AcrR family transcriptional regulator